MHLEQNPQTLMSHAVADEGMMFVVDVLDEDKPVSVEAAYIDFHSGLSVESDQQNPDEHRLVGGIGYAAVSLPSHPRQLVRAVQKFREVLRTEQS
jgi:hypothetical protein